MAVTLIINDFGARAEVTFYTVEGLKNYIKRNGTACLVDVLGSFGSRNVLATADWLDTMAGGVVEFPYDECDEWRMNEIAEGRIVDEWYL